MTDEKFLVLTNNPLLYQEAVRIPFPVLFYQEKLERLAERAVKLRKQGYCFCADPLGGYYFRYNPYHTLFLERQKKEQKKEKDDCLNDTVLWEALTNSIMGWEQMEKQEKEEKMLEDYQALDQSLHKARSGYFLEERNTDKNPAEAEKAAAGFFVRKRTERDAWPV